MERKELLKVSSSIIYKIQEIAIDVATIQESDNKAAGSRVKKSLLEAKRMIMDYMDQIDSIRKTF